MKAIERSYDQIQQEHHDLIALIDELEEFLKKPRPPVRDPEAVAWAGALSGMLLRLQERVIKHFQEEEASGLLHNLVEAFPRAARTVERLRSEHDRILDDLRAVLGAVLVYSESRESVRPHLRAWTLEILEEFVQHEHVETDLIQRLYTEDLGQGD